MRVQSTLLLFAVVGVSIVYSNGSNDCDSSSVWTWVCKKAKCVKKLASPSVRGTPLNKCKLTCGQYGGLLPKPRGKTEMSATTVPFLPRNILLARSRCIWKTCLDDYGRTDSKVSNTIKQAFDLFLNDLDKMYWKQIDKNCGIDYKKGGLTRKIHVFVDFKTNDLKLTLDTDESYQLRLRTKDPHNIHVTITAHNFFGVRHGFETLSQLTAFDETHNTLQIITSASISDRPRYPYRGVLLDTSRNFFSVASIMRLVSALSYSKMNTLHWHITDSHSFPIEIKSQPNMTKYGAYDKRKIYTHEDVRKIVRYAHLRGVRVLPEFDMPAHCGHGWEWGEEAGLGKLGVCIAQEPWQKFCLEPPCGQLNPANMNLYPILGQIFKELVELFEPDIFHIGGDEINLHCWNTTAEIREAAQEKFGGQERRHLLYLWDWFAKRAEDELLKANNNKQIPVIHWSNQLSMRAGNLKYFMDPKKHIIQMWTTTKDRHLVDVMTNGYRNILTTWDTLYLDCGYGNWLAEGNNWCSPYKDWKLYYASDPVEILKKNFGVDATESMKRNMLGQEAPMWSEQVDERSSESKIWPRAAALGERLWSNPTTGWRKAEPRMLIHRERLVLRGIQADALQPTWCHHHENLCFYDKSIQ